MFLVAPNESRELVAWPALIRLIAGLKSTTKGYAIDYVRRRRNGARLRNFDKLIAEVVGI